MLTGYSKPKTLSIPSLSSYLRVGKHPRLPRSMFDLTTPRPYLPLTELAKSETKLPEQTREKMRSRKFVFLHEQELLLLEIDGLKEYLRLTYDWMWLRGHTGPLWLSLLAHAYHHHDSWGLNEEGIALCHRAGGEPRTD